MGGASSGEEKKGKRKREGERGGGGCGDVKSGEEADAVRFSAIATAEMQDIGDGLHGRRSRREARTKGKINRRWGGDGDGVISFFLIET